VEGEGTTPSGARHFDSASYVPSGDTPNALVRTPIDNATPMRSVKSPATTVVSSSIVGQTFAPLVLEGDVTRG
jgi:hypothetical protein